jgi:dihydroneopterin aldolase
MSDLISIKGIKGFGFHGVFDFEKRDGQNFSVDIEVEIDLTKASKSDRLEDTVDYGVFTSIALAHITGEPVNLIEHLAGNIADEIKGSHSSILAVAVTVHKPHAPVSEEVSDISVTIRR